MVVSGQFAGPIAFREYSHSARYPDYVMTLYRFLADAVVLVHAAYIGLVVFGMLAILLGLLLRWKWVRNFWFRIVHLFMIGIVVFQALSGIICPLTTLEHHLRLKGGQQPYCGSFIGHWVHELIFFEGPPWVFTLCYCSFGAAVLATLILAPPRWPRTKVQASCDGLNTEKGAGNSQKDTLNTQKCVCEGVSGDGPLPL